MSVDCDICGCEADRVAFYTKTYWHGRCTIEYPAVCCWPCFNGKDIEAFTIVRGGDEHVDFITLEALGKMTRPQMGKLCSLRGRELNYFHAGEWKKKIWYLHFSSMPPEKKVEATD